MIAKRLHTLALRSILLEGELNGIQMRHCDQAERTTNKPRCFYCGVASRESSDDRSNNLPRTMTAQILFVF